MRPSDPPLLGFRSSFGISASPLRQRRVAHAEACSHVFRDQQDCRAVVHRVRLRQVLQGVDQELLPIDVSTIGGAFPTDLPALPFGVGIGPFRHDSPGESGTRNTVRGPGFAGLDMGLAKRWKMPIIRRAIHYDGYLFKFVRHI
jgi:hypothetical protein